jgi:tetratricopeptide (TPR) repeat protein
VAEWEKLAKEEESLLGRLSEPSAPSIAAALFYYLALAHAEQGEEALAEATAQRARQFSPVRSSIRLRARIDMALALVRRGRFRWAEREYRHVLDAGVLYPKVRAGLSFSETLHDQGDNLAAAELLAELLEIDPQQLEPILGRMGRTVREIRGRAAYFFACHWKEQGDRAKQIRYLDQAVRHHPGELDALIARYHLADKEAEFHQKTVKLIDAAAASYRQALAETPGEQEGEKAGLANEFAWLVGNTEGDLDEALRCARKAVELRPDAGAYWDTLAHVYYARGELRRAVESQNKAAEYAPHSGLIARKLVLFQHALAQGEPSEPEKTADRQTGKAQTTKEPADAEDRQPE